MTLLRLIGYWRSDEQPSWPNAKDFVDPLWRDDERRLVVRYLAAGPTDRVHRGCSDCRFCGEQNGNRELTDGTYLWPQGLAHYLRVHGLRLPKEFVTHAVSHTDTITAVEPSCIDDEIATDETDGSWWAEQRRP
jgi:hypothetical protein